MADIQRGTLRKVGRSLTLVDKDLDIEMRTFEILQITSENSQRGCWEASDPQEGQNKDLLRGSEDGISEIRTELYIRCLASHTANGFHQFSVRRKYIFHDMHDLKKQ